MKISREEYEAKRRARPDVFPDIFGEDHPACDLVSHPERQQDSVDEPVAAVPREAPRQGRLRILVASYRVRVTDNDNIQLGAKPLVDACILAGFAPSDSKLWCEIQHRQEQVSDPSQERTEVILENV